MTYVIGPNGKLAGRNCGTPLERFIAKCRHDPVTGCVVWIGGTTQGRGHHQPYGSFWFEGRRWFAHRWAAKYIHGLEIKDMQVDHCCPMLNTPNTLCVEHLQAILPAVNRELQWIRVQVGLDEYPFPEPGLYGGSPCFDPPAWLSGVPQQPVECGCGRHDPTDRRALQQRCA